MKKVLGSKKKVWILAAALAIVAFFAFDKFNVMAIVTGDSKAIKIAQQEVSRYANDDLYDYEFIGEAIVEHNSDDDTYVVSGWMNLYNDYEVEYRSMYIVSLQLTQEGYIPIEVNRFDDGMDNIYFYDFFDYGLNYEEYEEEYGSETE